MDIDSNSYGLGPHTIFNEHARDIMKYGAFLMCDRGMPGNVIYVFDGGSIANKDKFKSEITTLNTSAFLQNSDSIITFCFLLSKTQF